MITASHYVHQPVGDGQCRLCHVAAGHGAVAQTPAPNDSEVVWFATDYSLRTVHWFTLPAAFAGSPLSVVAHGPHGGGRAKTFMPTLVEIPALPADDNLALTITDLRVVEVKRGVFLSARLQWRSSRLSQTACLYGEKEPRTACEGEDGWGTEHEVVLTGLAANKKYHFCAVAIDSQARRVVSPEISFSTARFFSKTANMPHPSVPQTAFTLASQFWRSGDKIFVRFQSDRDVTLKLGHAVMAAEAHNTGLGQDHEALVDSHTLHVTVCYECHPQTKGKMSHPIDIRPKAGMHIPASGPPLINGKLTCLSCHQAHGSNNPYRLLTRTKKELCLSCHQNF